jgi:predicted ABC-type exoprotein transport system permease subunit
MRANFCNTASKSFGALWVWFWVVFFGKVFNIIFKFQIEQGRRGKPMSTIMFAAVSRLCHLITNHIVLLSNQIVHLQDSKFRQ